jgi:acetylornithine deacetylase/succinyl-diaminopimelate desuccinylase family protein
MVRSRNGLAVPDEEHALDQPSPLSAASESEARALGAIDEDETLALLRDLIRSPSENPPGEEAATARCLAAFFERHGIDHYLDEVAAGRPNLVATLGESDGPTLVFNGHLDTVPAGADWTMDPFGAELRDGRIYGRGACDMLGGVAAMSAATVALKSAAIPLRGRVVVHAVIDEEVDAKGSQHAARNAQADWVIVTEPSGGNVEAFGKGQLNVEITFTGKAAHSSRPDVGRNAIHDAAAFVARVEREHQRVSDDVYPGVGPPTFTTGIISGGTSGSIVPSTCTVTLDRRVLPTETLDEAQAHVERLLAEVTAARPELEATIRPTLRFPPFPPSDDNALATTVQAAVRDVGAGTGELGGATGATDAAWYAARGIPTVIYGPGNGATAHEPDEYILAAEVGLGTRALTLSAVRLLAAAATTGAA